MTTIRRFSAPTLLTEDTVVLGVPVKKWNQTFVGNFEKSLVEVKKRAGARPNTESDAGV